MFTAFRNVKKKKKKRTVGTSWHRVFKESAMTCFHLLWCKSWQWSHRWLKSMSSSQATWQRALSPVRTQGRCDQWAIWRRQSPHFWYLKKLKTCLQVCTIWKQTVLSVWAFHSCCQKNNPLQQCLGETKHAVPRRLHWWRQLSQMMSPIRLSPEWCQDTQPDHVYSTHWEAALEEAGC